MLLSLGQPPRFPRLFVLHRLGRSDPHFDLSWSDLNQHDILCAEVHWPVAIARAHHHLRDLDPVVLEQRWSPAAGTTLEGDGSSGGEQCEKKKGRSDMS